jgi:hypothetical protein
MWGPWGYPMMYPNPMNNQGPQQGQEDPFKTMKKWRKFLMREEEAKKAKEKEKEKKKGLCETIGHVGDAGKLVTLALVLMPILGPLFWLYCAFMMRMAKNVLQ